MTQFGVWLLFAIMLLLTGFERSRDTVFVNNSDVVITLLTSLNPKGNPQEIKLQPGQVIRFHGGISVDGFLVTTPNARLIYIIRKKPSNVPLRDIPTADRPRYDYSKFNGYDSHAPFSIYQFQPDGLIYPVIPNVKLPDPDVVAHFRQVFPRGDDPNGFPLKPTG